LLRHLPLRLRHVRLSRCLPPVTCSCRLLHEAGTRGVAGPPPAYLRRGRHVPRRAQVHRPEPRPCGQNPPPPPAFLAGAVPLQAGGLPIARLPRHRRREHRPPGAHQSRHWRRARGVSSTTESSFAASVVSLLPSFSSQQAARKAPFSVRLRDHFWEPRSSVLRLT
jgi:hypothetical protein